MSVSDRVALQTDIHSVYFDKDYPIGCYRTPYPFMASPGLNHRTGTLTALGRYADIRARFVLSARQFSY